MSSANRTIQFTDFSSSSRMLPCSGDSLRARAVAADTLGSLLLEMRDEVPELIPGVIDGYLEKTDKIDDARTDVKQGKTSKSKKKKSQSKKQCQIQSRRAIDTLFRNAYRAQLDMLSLAAVKANIMISLNGLLISMLIVSGTHLIGIDVWLAIPVILFLLGSASATIFAVLAARPEVSRKKHSLEDFSNDKACLLVFEDFSDLSKTEYVDAMSTMLEDDDRVYKNMIAHVHELGLTADRKYRKLHYSYTVFIGGIVLSILSLLLLEGMKWSSQVPAV